MTFSLDWLEAHRVNLDCYNKTFECMDEEGNPRVVKEIPKVVFVRYISVMQLRSVVGKVAECMQLMFWKQQRMKLLG